MKNTIKKIQMITVLGAGLSMAQQVGDVGYDNYLASEAVNDIPTIQTSKTHHMSRLLNMQTGDVLESYDLAFSGSGNIHSILKNFNTEGLEGSLVLGLGNVVDIGYELSEFYTTEEKRSNFSEGFIKLQGVSQGKYTPSLAIAYSQALKSNYEASNEQTYKVDVSNYQGMISKNFMLGAFDVGTHFTMQATQFGFKDSESGSTNQVVKFQPQIGLTWQKDEGTQFILENRWLNLLDPASALANNPKFESAIESNFAVRFHIRNWLMFDTGVSNQYNSDSQENKTQIHANISGVIPLASLSNRISNYF